MYSWLCLARDNTWQERQEQKNKGKPRPAGQELEPGTMNKSPGQIANELKQHSRDYDHAQSRLNNYINRKGKEKRDGNDESRLDQAKEALRNAYGVREPKKTQTNPKPAKPATPAKPASAATKKAKKIKADPVLMPSAKPNNADAPLLYVGLGAVRRLKS